MIYGLWLFLFKLYPQNDIFKLIKKSAVTVVKSFEDFKTKYEKILFGIKFMKTCRQGNLLPTFAKVR